MSYPCRVTQDLNTHFAAQEAAEINWQLYGKDAQRAKVEHIQDLAVCLLDKQPTNIRILHSAYNYTRDDVFDDLLNHPLFESTRAAYRAGNKKPFKDLVIRVAQRGIARSMHGAFDADEMGFLK